MDIQNKIVHIKEHTLNLLNSLFVIFNSIALSYIITFSFIIGDEKNTRSFGFLFFIIFLFIFYSLSKTLIKRNTSFIFKYIISRKERLNYFYRLNILSFTPFIILGVIVTFQFIITLYFHNLALMGSIETFDRYILLIERINSTVFFLFLIVFCLILSLSVQYTILIKLEKIKRKSAIFSTLISLIMAGLFGLIVYAFFYILRLTYAIIGFMFGGGMFGP